MVVMVLMVVIVAVALLTVLVVVMVLMVMVVAVALLAVLMVMVALALLVIVVMMVVMLGLLGHNIYNSMAAALAAKAMDIDNQAIREGLATFEAVEHRLEKVLSIKDVLYINDSKATNVDAAWYALECQTRPVVWIVGGTDKGNDYSTLVPLVKEKVKAIICLGVDNTKIHNAFGEHIDRMYDVTSAQDAVKKAHAIAQPGDVVLLSPCCASFDLFKNYEDRGRQFKEAVRNL